ncbi:MAG: type III pantothenate kinase [Vulcanimicrobiota bacterium]
MKWHLTLDAGNSQLVGVLFHNQARVGGFRLPTHPHPSSQELVEAFRSLLSAVSEGRFQLTVCSVVPALQPVLMDAVRLLEPAYFHWVDWSSPHGFTASDSASREIGADLISGLVGAREFGQEAFVVIDCGTATTLTLLSQQQRILGVAILPGLVTQMHSLTRSASHLPESVGLQPPAYPYGNDTVEALQSGIIYGHAAAIEGLIARYRTLLTPQRLTAVGCGGLFHRIRSLCPTVEIVETELVNLGCRVLGARAYAGGNSAPVETQRTFGP